MEFYTKKTDDINAELKDSTKKTDRYIENEVSWDEIIAKREALPKNSVDYVLMCLFTMMPPRRNLDYIAKIGKPQENSNWYDGVNFYFGNYKTKGAYHTQVVPVPNELKHVIENYLEHRPFKCNDLLGKKSGLPFKTKDIQTTLNKVIGKKVGCTMLRSIFLSSKYGDVMKEMKHDTDAMATSVSVAQSNYIKN